MPYQLNYRRPAYVPGSSRSSINGEAKQKSINESISSGKSGMSAGIPDALSFDRIIAGGTCPPCTVRDFMNYLKYIEFAAENLQFYLWHRDYTKRFGELPESQRALSPEWTVEQAEAEAAGGKPATLQAKLSPEAAAVFKGTAFDSSRRPAADPEKTNPFHTPPRTPIDEPTRIDYASSVNSHHGSDGQSTLKPENHNEKAETAYREAGLKWQPFTVQPFREEITRIIAIYIADGGARQLNLSARERTALLHALENTTHPSAFREVLVTVEWSLRCQAHPNFIRWTICNGNRPRVIFARGLGLFGIVAGLLTGLLLTLSSAGRAWRVMSMIGLMIGIATLIAAWKGMCVVLHGMHHRHLRPWELFADDDDIDVSSSSSGTTTSSSLDLKKDSMDSLNSRNSFEHEPWVARYEKRNLVRKVFDREVWVEEPALRQIQDTIFLQACLGALLVSAVVTGVFCAVPRGGFF